MSGGIGRRRRSPEGTERRRSSGPRRSFACSKIHCRNIIPSGIACLGAIARTSERSVSSEIDAAVVLQKLSLFHPGQHLATLRPLRDSLRDFLVARSAAYHAAQNPTGTTTSSSPALMLRNTVTAATDRYTDSTAPPARRSGPVPETQGERPLSGPPRSNKLRRAYVEGGRAGIPAAMTTATLLPEPGARDEESTHVASGAAGSLGPDPLVPRREGRRVPRLADSVSHLAQRSSVSTPAHSPYGSLTLQSAPAPLPLPGEGDSDEDPRPALPPIGHPVQLRSGPAPPVTAQDDYALAGMVTMPVPPVPPVPPPSVMRWYAQTQSGNSETPAPASAPSLPEPSPEVKPAELPDRTDRFSAKEAPTKRRTPGQLRKVLLPLGLVRHFVRVIAAENTAQNVETCALLLGRLVSPGWVRAQSFERH